MYLFQSCVPGGTTPMTGASAMTLVVRKLTGERAMVEPMRSEVWDCGLEELGR